MAAPLPVALDISVAQVHGRPAVVLVLDYSASMANSDKIESLRQGVVRILRSSPDIDWAAVLFDSSVRGYVGFNRGDTRPEIERLVLQTPLGGGTDTQSALNKAGRLLRSPSLKGTRPFVILISDGIPNDPAMAGTAARVLLRQTTLATLGIGMDEAGAAFMRSIAGTRERVADSSWAKTATQGAEIEPALRSLVDRIRAVSSGAEIHR
jgi:Mg-chelatase subunit ChlD